VARDFRARADKEFLAHHYEAAASLYDQAGRADKAALAGAEEPWAYCKLFAVNEALKKPEPPPAADLEREVRTAMSLAPKLDPCRSGTGRAGPRPPAPPAAAPADRPADRTEETAVEVRHHARGQVSQSYAVAETANFRVFHNQSREVAEKAARVAEAARTASY